MAFSTPPPCPAESVRTDGHMTITSQPKFLGSIGYQICLAIELRWWALPPGSANNNNNNNNNNGQNNRVIHSLRE